MTIWKIRSLCKAAAPRAENALLGLFLAMPSTQPRGMQQIQQLCGADDNPRIRMNTGDLQHRDPYSTQIFDLAFNWVDTRIREVTVKNAVPGSARMAT